MNPGFGGRSFLLYLRPRAKEKDLLVKFDRSERLGGLLWMSDAGAEREDGLEDGLVHILQLPLDCCAQLLALIDHRSLARFAE